MVQMRPFWDFILFHWAQIRCATSMSCSKKTAVIRLCYRVIRWIQTSLYISAYVSIIHDHKLDIPALWTMRHWKCSNTTLSCFQRTHPVQRFFASSSSSSLLKMLQAAHRRRGDLVHTSIQNKTLFTSFPVFTVSESCHSLPGLQGEQRGVHTLKRRFNKKGKPCKSCCLMPAPYTAAWKDATQCCLCRFSRHLKFSTLIVLKQMPFSYMVAVKPASFLSSISAQ